MTHTNTDNPPPISRDGIESWLDVLTSMLSLPPSQRTQVRDELEDHLRSRVDDLLITGQTEAQAIRTAIAELGETAQLARHISSANRTPKSFRRFAMNATFFVLAGSILTASVSMMMPTATLHQTQRTAETESVSASQHQQSEPELLDSVTFEVRGATIADLIQHIDRNTERPLIVHWELLYDLGYEGDAPLNIDADPITAALVLTILAERIEPVLRDSIAVLEKDDHVEISTRTHFDRRTTERRIYDLTEFASGSNSGGGVGAQSDRAAAETRNAMQRVTELLQSHISPDAWVNLGGDTASATVLNTTLVVSAPERMHIEIESLLEELKIQQQAQVHDKRMQSEQALQRIRKEYEVAKKEYLTRSNEFGRIQLRGQQLEVRMASGELSDEEVDQARQELGDLGLMLKEFQLELNEQERRYMSLQSLLIGAESEQLRAELN